MNERETLLKELKGWPAERAKNRPTTADDFGTYDPAVRDALNELGVDYPAAAEYAHRHKLMMLAANSGAEVLNGYDVATREFISRTRDRLNGPLRPRNLAAAVERMEKEVEFRKTLMTKQVATGLDCFKTIKTDTAATEAEMLLKAEKALGRLNVLGLFEGDIESEIKAIFESAGMLWNPAPSDELTPQTAPALTGLRKLAHEGALHGATIEPTEVSGGQLYPAG